jgi:hypothetical protein
VPADRLIRIEAILERARQLSGADILALVGAYRGECRPGERDALEGEQRRRRARIISIATARSGLSRQAHDVQASAVRSAAEQHREAGRLGPLGLLHDAELAVADAALAVLLEDHLSKEIAALLGQPFEEATMARTADLQGAGR